MVRKPVTENDIEIRVRYCETDAMGLLHHANYIVYFEMGRTELLRSAGVSYRELEEDGLFMVVVRLETRYHQPARYDDILRLKTTAKRVSAAKIEHEYHLYRDDLLLAQGASMLACVDSKGQVQRVPEWMRTE